MYEELMATNVIPRSAQDSKQAAALGVSKPPPTLDGALEKPGSAKHARYPYPCPSLPVPPSPNEGSTNTRARDSVPHASRRSPGKPSVPAHSASSRLVSSLSPFTAPIRVPSISVCPRRELPRELPQLHSPPPQTAAYRNPWARQTALQACGVTVSLHRVPVTHHGSEAARWPSIFGGRHAKGLLITS